MNLNNCSKTIKQKSKIIPKSKKKNFKLNNGHKKCLLKKTTNKDLCDILENYSNKANISQNASQNSLFMNHLPSSTCLFREILTKTPKINEKIPKPLRRLPNQNIYLVENTSNVSSDINIKDNNKSKEKILKRDFYKVPVNTTSETQLNLGKYNNNEQVNMELQCKNLETKIKSLKKDLEEMEHCLRLMRNIKENISSQFITNDILERKNLYNSNNIELKPPLNTDDIDVEPITSLNLCANLPNHKSLGEMTIKKEVERKEKWKPKYIENVKSKHGSFLGTSLTSDCTWVSSSIIESQGRTNKEGSFYKDNSMSISDTSLEMCRNLQNNGNRCQQGFRENIFKRLWHSFKLSLKLKKTPRRINNKQTKILLKNRDNSSVSHYFTATENKTLSNQRNK